MQNILFYAELYPFRDSFTQHAAIALNYIRLAKQIRSLGGGAFVLTNNETADRLIADDPSAAFFILRPAKADREKIRRHLSPWTEGAVKQWVSFATRMSPITDVYYEVLRKVYAFFPFDLVVSWGDNEALNEFASSKRVDVLHLELGPTRHPFPETFYFDPVGTNSRALFRSQLLESNVDCPDRDFWIASASAEHSSETKAGPYDGGFMLRGRPSCLSGISKRVCYIPLQLSDDLNMQLGSNFSTPTQFLEHVLPNVIASNFVPVIKPHPYSHTRAINLKEEARALAFASKYEECFILDGEDAQSGAWLIRNSDVVVTVNSSVGFEASLLGTKVLLAGEAAYDALRFPRFDQRDLGRQVSEYDSQTQDLIVEQMLGRILYPSKLLTTRRFARALLSSLTERNGTDAAERLRRRLGNPTDYAFGWDPRTSSAGAGALPAELKGFLNRRVARRHNQILIGDLEATIDNSVFRAGIEDSLATVSESMNEYSVRGWAYDPSTRTPPLAVLLADANRVIASAAFNEVRDHLARKDLVSCMAGFSLSAANVELAGDPFLIILSHDLRARLVPLAVGRYEVENDWSDELLS
jgi:hypothetical protein